MKTASIDVTLQDGTELEICGEVPVIQRMRRAMLLEDMHRMCHIRAWDNINKQCDEKRRLTGRSQ